MAQNITLLGASYSDVPAVILPKTGGGTATFTDVTDTTAAAADVASGKYFYTSAGVKTAGTASGGGGGLTSVVRGEFKYTAADWYTIALPYTGTGYPIAISVFVKGGINSTSVASLIRRYGILVFHCTLNDMATRPSYNGTDSNYYFGWYKNSTSDATVGANTSGATVIYKTSTSTSNGIGDAMRISGDKEIKVRTVVAGTNTSRYGFLVNVDYEYIVTYSS